MKKFLKWFVIIAGVLLLLFKFIAQPYLKEQTKKHSPEQTITHTMGDTELEVYYNRPYKKGREIFGGLVPYGKVWRTGANEASTFETTKDITVAGKPLPAGKYTLWTIPNQDSWEVIFNKKMYGWGVTLISGGKETPREPGEDALQVTVPTQKLGSTMEQFTISFDQSKGHFLTLAWDDTKVSVPIE